MDEDYIDFGIGVCIDFGDFKSFDLVEIYSGALTPRH
jgi:hypothetical protein